MTNLTTVEPCDPILKGYLVIYVYGHKVSHKCLVHVISDGEKLISVPDRFVSPPDYQISAMNWWMEGWAVGDNARDRLCSRKGPKPLRRFHSYDEAVAYVFARQKKHTMHRYVLVYVTAGIGGRQQEEVVRSLDEIHDADARVAAEIAENEAMLARRQAATTAEHPHLTALQGKHGLSMAWTLSHFVKDVREKGAEAVKTGMPRASFYRHLKRLKEAGIEIDL